MWEGKTPWWTGDCNSTLYVVITRAFDGSTRANKRQQVEQLLSTVTGKALCWPKWPKHERLYPIYVWYLMPKWACWVCQWLQLCVEDFEVLWKHYIRPAWGSIAARADSTEAVLARIDVPWLLVEEVGLYSVHLYYCSTWGLHHASGGRSNGGNARGLLSYLHLTCVPKRICSPIAEALRSEVIASHEQWYPLEFQWTFAWWMKVFPRWGMM